MEGSYITKFEDRDDAKDKNVTYIDIDVTISVYILVLLVYLRIRPWQQDILKAER